MVWAYNNFEQDFPWESRGSLQQDNCQFGDMLKDQKRKVSLNVIWLSLWVTVHYPTLGQLQHEQQRNQEA